MKRFFLFVFLAALLLPTTASAADVETCNPGNILPPCTCDGSTCSLQSFIDLFANLYAFGLHILIPLGALFIVIGSVILLTASGYSNRIEMGKNIIRQAVTGTVIVLLSWVIIDTSVLIITGSSDKAIFNKPWYAGFTYECTGDLRQGCSGGNVKTVQKQLKALGYDVPLSGTYDSRTTAAVGRFQADYVGRVLSSNGLDACDQSANALIVWKVVFPSHSSCSTSIPSACLVTSDEIKEKKIPTDRTADQKTQQAISLLGSSVANSISFRDACRS